MGIFPRPRTLPNTPAYGSEACPCQRAGHDSGLGVNIGSMRKRPGGRGGDCIAWRPVGRRVVHALAVLFVASAVASRAHAQSPPLLQLQGQPYSGGAMTLHFSGTVGQPTLLLYGLDPLDPPAQTTKGPFYIGTVFNAFTLGAIPSLGRIDMPFVMPPLDPVLAGIPIVLQGLVPGALSNPATLPLDQPYLLPANALVIDHPVPSEQAAFGDTVAAGDFNADGVMDLAVGAWFEDVAGIDKAGRVYVMWGPEFGAFAALEPAVPAYLLHFGQGLAVADFDGDGTDDLAVGEGTGGDPPTPGQHGHVYVFRGGENFATTPWIQLQSAGTALEAYVFGRLMQAGDLDLDGHPDLVVAAPDAIVQGFSRAGRLEVFYGPVYGPPTLIENPEPKTNDFFGSRVSLADVTGDGIVDVVEASGRAKVGNISQAGRLHVYDGPTLGLLATIDNPEPVANARFGEGLLAANLDGDGRAELIVADVKNTVWLVRDALGAVAFEKRTKPPSPNPKPGASSYGYFFATTDANGDGFVDVVISDIFEGDSQGCGGLTNGGTVYVALGPHYCTYLRLGNPSTACGDSFGWSLRFIDVNGNGIADLVTGDHFADIAGVTNAGRVQTLIR